MSTVASRSSTPSKWETEAAATTSTPATPSGTAGRLRSWGRCKPLDMAASHHMPVPASFSWKCGSARSKTLSWRRSSPWSWLMTRMAQTPGLTSQPAAINATAALGAEAASDLKTPWRDENASFSSWAEAKAMLGRPKLLKGWAKSAGELLSMVDGKAADVLDLSDAWGVSSNNGPLNIYFVGEAGGGKSTLVRALAEGIAEIPTSVVVSATIGREQNDIHVPLPSGLTLIDTQGFRIPVPPAEPEPNATLLDRLTTRTLNGYMHRRQISRWLYQLSDLRLKFEAVQPSQQPAAAVVFVHKAGARIAVDRIAEALAVPARSNIPTFVALTDIHAVDERDLEEIRESLEGAINLTKRGTLGRKIPLLQMNSAPKTVRGVQIEPSGLHELVTELLNSLRPEDILRHAKRPQPSSRAMLFSLVGLAALIWSGHPLFALPLAGATAAWQTWSARSHKARSAAINGGPNAVRSSSAAGTPRLQSMPGHYAVIDAGGYSQTAKGHHKARVEQNRSTRRDESRAPSKRIDNLRDAEISSQHHEVQALNPGSPVSASSRDSSESFQVDARLSTQDQIRALDCMRDGRRKLWPLSWFSSSNIPGLNPNFPSMSTKNQIHALESLDRLERHRHWWSPFDGSRWQEYTPDYPEHELGPSGGYEAEAPSLQPPPAKSAERDASDAALSEAEKVIEDTRRFRENRQLFTTGKAALEDNGGRRFSDSREEPNVLPVNKDVETPSAAELAEMEARWSTVINTQEEALQEAIGTVERLEGELTKANSRIEGLTEDVLLHRCRLITEKPGAIGAIPADDRTTSAPDEAKSGGV